MLLTIIFAIVAVFYFAMYMNDKKKIKRLTQRLSQLEKNTLPERNEEFVLGVTKSNHQFSGNVLVDPLTGLPGREAFNDRLVQALNQSQRFEKSFAVILLDIHEFSLLNETQGYEAGDKLLREVANRLQNAIRQIDTMTRYAGNTFIFLLPQLAMPETAAYVAQRLLDSIVQPFIVEDKPLLITANIGVAIYPTDGQDVKTLIKNANDALHQAKIGGNGRYQFYRQELHALGERELNLNRFLNSPDLFQKLMVYYQPYIDVKTTEVIGIHAIPHLSSPELGLVSYLQFTKIAENIGKIDEIGQWLLKSAIAQYQAWKNANLNPQYISMNVTLRQIENPKFIYTVSKVIEEMGIEPKRIIFQISGENLLSQTNTLEKSFTLLSEVGIQIAVSVFALGHFALQKITQLPINYLVIDAKLLRDKNPHEENKRIVHMIVTLAKEIDIAVMGEGVENNRQKDLLQELGCEIMQGPLFGGPVPLETLDISKSKTFT